MFEFYLKVPLVQISTHLMSHSYESLVFHYIEWNFRIWKWSWCLYWGKNRMEREIRRVVRYDIAQHLLHASWAALNEAKYLPDAEPREREAIERMINETLDELGKELK